MASLNNFCKMTNLPSSSDPHEPKFYRKGILMFLIVPVFLFQMDGSRIILYLSSFIFILRRRHLNIVNF